MKNAKTVKANANEDDEQEKSLAYLENLQASMTTAQFNNLEWNEHSKTNNVGLELVSDFAKAKTKQLKQLNTVSREFLLFAISVLVTSFFFYSSHLPYHEPGESDGSFCFWCQQ